MRTWLGGLLAAAHPSPIPQHPSHPPHALLFGTDQPERHHSECAGHPRRAMPHDEVYLVHPRRDQRPAQCPRSNKLTASMFASLVRTRLAPMEVEVSRRAKDGKMQAQMVYETTVEEGASAVRSCPGAGEVLRRRAMNRDGPGVTSCWRG